MDAPQTVLLQQVCEERLREVSRVEKLGAVAPQVSEDGKPIGATQALKRGGPLRGSVLTSRQHHPPVGGVKPMRRVGRRAGMLAVWLHVLSATIDRNFGISLNQTTSAKWCPARRRHSRGLRGEFSARFIVGQARGLRACYRAAKGKAKTEQRFCDRRSHSRPRRLFNTPLTDCLSPCPGKNLLSPARQTKTCRWVAREKPVR